MALKLRPLVTVAGIDRILGSTMAEWLRPRVFIAKNGLNIRRISVGSTFCPLRKSIGWTVGDKKHVPEGVSQYLRTGWPSG